MGLDDLYPFKPEEKIIEYAIEAKKPKQKRLVGMTLDEFVWETASESKAPGGGSISSAMGAMGAALGTMVANLSSHKRGWDERWQEFSDWAVKGKECHDELLRAIDDDTDAFNKIVAAWGLPDGSDEEKAAKNRAIQDATKEAIEVPFHVMELSFKCMEVCKAMAEIGNPASVSDAGVGAIAARSAVMGAYLNVRINAGDVEDKRWIDDVLARGQEIQDQAIALEHDILEIVNGKL
jgi:glutamate formiminotransferase/formiminotetrahydrofolate cyclodeaminase